MSCRQLAALRGKGTVFVHLDAAALTHQAGVARVEGMGPMLVQSLAELLGHHDVSLQPVIDLSRRVRADRYEHGDHPQGPGLAAHRRGRVPLHPRGPPPGTTSTSTT